ncbi:hypothetical protein CEP54_016068 [Fusarium duplospermum]|uniref:Uncharacterized protein n=1 Tax=Fusarium duplospermum TaxID=1325734 RepID=A0A428NIK1_9HYPO|nr:hypothetical protein CEP54_016068 [Fusarium duplospermum]
MGSLNLGFATINRTNTSPGPLFHVNNTSDAAAPCKSRRILIGYSGIAHALIPIVRSPSKKNIRKQTHLYAHKFTVSSINTSINRIIAYCVLAAVANWLFLAGFVVFPGTFATISQATTLGDSQTGRVVQHAVQNTPLLVVGSLCCFTGGVGMGWVGWSQRHNYVWLSDRIFLSVSPNISGSLSNSPSLLNSVVTLFMSLINVYTAQEGGWSVTRFLPALTSIQSWPCTGYCT